MTHPFFIAFFFAIPISNITFTGNKSIPSRELNSYILSKIKSEYSEFIASQDKERIIRVYYNRGFFNTLLEMEKEESSRGISLVFKIKEGIRPKVQKIRIEGDEERGIKKHLFIEISDYFIQEKIKKTEEEIERFYKDRGYAFAEVNSSPVLDSGLLIFKIEKGGIFYIKEILIKGLKFCRPKVVLREIELKRGELFSQKKVLNSQKKIYRLGFFSTVDVQLLKESPESLSLIFSVRELRTKILNLGIGLSIPLAFLFSFGIEEMNLFNLGHRFKIEPSFKINIEREWEGGLETRYIFPYFLKTNLIASIIPFYWYEEKKEFSRSTRGAELRLSRIYSENIQANMTNKYKYFDIQPKTTLPEAIEGITNSIKLQVMFDYRNEFFNPKEGTYFVPVMEYAGGILKGANNFIRFEGEQRFFISLFKGIVLAQRLKSGYIIATGRLSPDEKYYVGGQYTLRGYKEKSVGPDSIGDEHYGSILINANIEMRMTLYKNLGLVSFFDAGCVANGMDLTKEEFLKFGTGLGLRYNTPIGPIRLDFGIPLKEKGYGLYLGLYHIF